MDTTDGQRLDDLSRWMRADRQGKPPTLKPEDDGIQAHRKLHKWLIQNADRQEDVTGFLEAHGLHPAADGQWDRSRVQTWIDIEAQSGQEAHMVEGKGLLFVPGEPPTLIDLQDDWLHTGSRHLLHPEPGQEQHVILENMSDLMADKIEKHDYQEYKGADIRYIISSCNSIADKPQNINRARADSRQEISRTHPVKYPVRQIIRHHHC